MKKIVILLIIASLLAGSIFAQESGCPADIAAKKGHNAFGEFHEIMAPVWHKAWPNKDFEALLAAGPLFAKKFIGIAEMKPDLKTETRTKTFLELRKQFKVLVEQFALACKNNDRELAYKLMPDLHDAFEMTASSVLPVHYPEISGIVITLNLILESHLPIDNKDGIIGSTETLAAKVKFLNEASIPDELKEQKDALIIEFKAIKETALLMKECCDNEEMALYKEHAKTLSKLLIQFQNKYI